MIALRACTSAELTETDLRAMRELFDAAWPQQAFTEADWTSLLGGRHFIVELDDALASHASVVPRRLRVADRELKTGYVEAVATRPELQGRGLATRTMRAVGDHVRKRYELGGLDTGSQGFYERLGWERWRGPTFVRTADGARRTPEEDGNVMILRTPSTPADLDLDAPISCDWRPGDVW